MAIDSDGNLLASADPQGAASTWRRTRVTSSADPLLGVSCPTISFCVASSYGGEIAVSRHPTGGRGAWRKFRLHHRFATDGLGPISCPSPRLCVMASPDELKSSTNPAGGPGAWRDAYFPGDGQLGHAFYLTGISCPSTRLCVAVDSSGYAFTSIDPTGGARAWARSTIADPFAHNFGLTGISCLTRLCVAVDNYGQDYVSTDPAAPAVQAARPHVSRASLSGVAADRPRLTFNAGAGIPPGRALRSITLAAPPRIAFSRSRQSLRGGVGVKDSKGRRLSFTTRLGRGGQLTIVLAHPASSAQLTISGGALSASRSLAAAVRQGKAGRLTFVVKLGDAGRKSTTLSLMVRPS